MAEMMSMTLYKSCKVLMMMKATKLGWAGAGKKEPGWSRAEVGQE